MHLHAVRSARNRLLKLHGAGCAGTVRARFAGPNHTPHTGLHFVSCTVIFETPPPQSGPRTGGNSLVPAARSVMGVDGALVGTTAALAAPLLLVPVAGTVAPHQA